MDAFGGADPQAAVGVEQDTSHRPGKAVFGDVVDEALVLEAAEASLGSDPDASVAIVGHEARNIIVDETVGRRVHRELSVLQSADAPAVGADPEAAVHSLGKDSHLALAKLGVDAIVEGGKAHAVETREAAFGAEPEVAVPCLQNGVHGVLGQPLRLTPHLYRRPGDGIRTIGCRCRGNGHQETP